MKGARIGSLLFDTPLWHVKRYYFAVRRGRSMPAFILDLLVGAVGAIGCALVALGMLLTAYVDETCLEPKQRLAQPLLASGAVLGLAFFALKLIFWN